MMKQKIVHIGVNLVQGCDLPGGEKAMQKLNESISFEEILEIDKTLLKDEKPLYLKAITDLNLRLKESIIKHTQDNQFPIVFGGDHALAIGSIAASAKQDDWAVLWIDAHGDCNTDESSISQRIHGMPLAVTQGYGHPDLISIMDHFIPSKNVLTLGIRSLDPLEEELMKKWGLGIITMEEIHRKGLAWCIHEINAFMTKHKNIHCSFDCDSMDPALIPGVNTPVSDGFNQAEILELLSHVFKHETLKSLDIVEFNPTNDNGNTLKCVQDVCALMHSIKE